MSDHPHRRLFGKIADLVAAARAEERLLAEHRSGFTRTVKEADAGAGKCEAKETP